jgi:hypothetical protein
MKTGFFVLLFTVLSLLSGPLPASADGYWVRDIWVGPYGYYWQDRYYAYAPARGRRYRVVQPRYSAVACDSYAANFARNASAQGDILAGGAFGSLAGLGIGSLFAASGVGAAIGATAGIIGGGAVRNQREQQLYAAAFQDCLQGIVR